MSESAGRSQSQAYSLAGEGMPQWLMLGFALIGLLTAAAAAWVFLADQPSLPEQPSRQVAARTESGPPKPVPPAAQAVEPVNVPAKPATTATSEKDLRSTPLQTAPGTATVADGQRVEVPADQALPAKASPAAMLADCPQPVTIMFNSNSVRPMGTGSRERVAPLLVWLARHPEAKLSVEGHADSIGAEQWNLILSYRRAKALVDLLREWGVPQEQLVVRAAGQLQPIAGIPNSAAANRRVILQVEGSENCRVSSTGGEPR